MKPTHQEQFLSILAEAGIPSESKVGDTRLDQDPTSTIIRIENAGNVGGYRYFLQNGFSSKMVR